MGLKMHVEQVLGTILESINFNPAHGGKSYQEGGKRNSLQLLTHKNIQDPLFSLWSVFPVDLTEYEEILSSFTFPVFPQEDPVRMSQWYSGIRPLNTMRYLPFSLHHFDFFFLVKPARCFMKCLCHHWGNYLLTLQCSLDQCSTEVRPLWWKESVESL